MSELAKLSRWVVPGAIWLFAFFATLQSQRIFLPGGTSIVPAIATSTGLAIATLSGIPLGMLTYQLYFYQYSQVPFLRYLHRDVGKESLLGADMQGCEQVDAHWETYSSSIGWIWIRNSATGKPLAWPSTREGIRKEYYRIRESNWVLAERALLEKESPASEKTMTELARLSDIYHTLGAARLALVFGYTTAVVVGAILCFGHPDHFLGYLVGVGTSAVVVCVLGKVLHANRRHTLDRRTALAVALLRATP